MRIEWSTIEDNVLQRAVAMALEAVSTQVCLPVHED
jgi:hypothetical protein